MAKQQKGISLFCGFAIGFLVVWTILLWVYMESSTSFKVLGTFFSALVVTGLVLLSNYFWHQP